MITRRISGALATLLVALAAAGCGGSEDVARLDKEVADLKARVAKLEGSAPGAAGTASVAATPKAPATPAASGTASKETAAAAKPAVETSPATQTPAAGRGRTAGPFDIAKNDAMKGRLGRLLVSFAGETQASGSLVKVYAAGDPKDKLSKQIATEYGVLTKELMPGSYHVSISGRLVDAIPVESGHDTRLHTGVLRVNAASDTLVKLFEVGATSAVHSFYGAADVGLPVGPIEVEIGGQRSAVTVEDGKITEF